MSEGTDGASPPDNLDALGSYISPSSSLLDGSDRNGNKKESTDLLSGVQPTPIADSSTDVVAPATPFSIDDEDEDDDDVPHHNSDAPKLDTSNRSSSSKGSKSKSKKNHEGRPMSPLTPGDNDDASVQSTSSRKSQKGAKGAKLTKLSAKTTKIMSDYQAYLAEIETEFPTTSASADNSGDDTSAASNSLKSATENVRGVYEAAEEGHSYNSASLRAAMDRESNSSIGSGGIGGGLSIAGLNMEPLARAWDYSRSTIATIGIPGPSDAVSSMNINARNMTNGDDIDDGITDITDYESQMLSRGQKYTHPWFHSRRVKRGVCMLVGVCALIGLSVGISKKSKNDKMDKLEDEMNASSGGEMIGEVYDGTTKSPPLNWAGYTDTEKTYETAALKYKPLDYNRHTGWLGQTYTEALIFCGQKSGYAVCPYDAICPNGHDKEPLGGYKDGEMADENGWSWIPVLDSPNEWIQVRIILILFSKTILVFVFLTVKLTFNNLSSCRLEAKMHAFHTHTCTALLQHGKSMARTMRRVPKTSCVV